MAKFPKNMVDRTDPNFWDKSNKSDESSNTKGSTVKNLPTGETNKKFMAKFPKNIVDHKNPNFWDKSNKADTSTGSAKENPSPYVFFTTACAFCLMVVGLPVLNQKTSRGVAGDSDPANMSIVTKEDGTQYTTQVYKDENRYWKVALMKVNQERTPSSKAKNNFFQILNQCFLVTKRGIWITKIV